MLVVFAGLPGVGKTTIAREVARRIGAVYLRIDSIEHALRQSGAAPADLHDLGYRAAYAAAEDNLRLSLAVVADSVNPIDLTREAWQAVAGRAGAPIAEIEVVCSDAAEHRRRVETRGTDFPGWTLTWQEVADRVYHPWTGDRIVLDTATRGVDQNVAAAVAAIAAIGAAGRG